MPSTCLAHKTNKKHTQTHHGKQPHAAQGSPGAEKPRRPSPEEREGKQWLSVSSDCTRADTHTQANTHTLAHTHRHT